MLKPTFNLLLPTLALVCLVTVQLYAQQDTTGRPQSFAQPMQLEGVPNLYKVDENLYRSAQPTKQGMKALKHRGIKTVVNLRWWSTDQAELEGVDLKYEQIKMTPWISQNQKVIRFLKTVTDTSKTPVLVHCLHGADRTGISVAAYRVVVQGWSKQEAIREMTQGGFNFHWYFSNLIRYIEELDVESMRKQIGQE